MVWRLGGVQCLVFGVWVVPEDRIPNSRDDPLSFGEISLPGEHTRDVTCEVGRNGAGKTTLMSTIAAGGVSGMTADVKTLHVKPEACTESVSVCFSPKGRKAVVGWRTSLQRCGGTHMYDTF